MLLSFLVVFFFYCLYDHLDLHSFPTRRSSDLAPCRTPRISSRKRCLPPGVDSTVSRSGRRCAPGNRRVQDRKSTRLNSSHRCISYAVFCLKKKKINELT